MKEQEAHHREDEYWTDDILLCEADFRQYQPGRTSVRARVHAAEESYRRDDVDHAIENLRTLTGTRSYVHLRPYALEPDYRVTVALRPPAPTGQLGEVVSSSWEGMRHRDVGQVQAWHYPTDRLSVIWESFFYEPFRVPALADDHNMSALWDGVEAFMCERFPQTEQLVTPHRDPEFADDQYAAFLRGRGYDKVTQAAFGKAVRRR